MTRIPRPTEVDNLFRFAKRIAALIGGYSKTFHGIRAVETIGLGVIREACPHFGLWLTKPEQLAVQE